MRPGRFLLFFSLLLVPSLGLSTTQAYPLREVELGAAAPGFELKDVRGKTHSLSSYAGKVVVVAYVRPGQSFSIRVLEALARLRRAYPASEVAVLAVRRPGDGGAAPGDEDRLGFPVLLDPDRSLYGSWGLFVLPTTVTLDRRHRVAAAFSTFPEGMEDDLAASVDKALGRAHAAVKPAKEAGPVVTPEIGLARRLLASGRAEEAYEALAPVLRSPSPSPDGLLLSCEALLALGRTEEAAARGEAALKAGQGSPRASLLMGRVRTLQGRYQEAEALLKAAARTPEAPQARYRLGQLYERQGRKDAALSEYRAALESSHGP